jgi:hypothetical protein
MNFKKPRVHAQYRLPSGNIVMVIACPGVHAHCVYVKGHHSLWGTDVTFLVEWLCQFGVEV